MDRRDIKEVAVQVCRALSCVHSHGMVHCDVKPEDIMLIQGHDGGFHTKPFDFSFVKFPRSIEVHGPLFSKDAEMGAPAYMSPEQMMGKDFDRRMDV